MEDLKTVTETTYFLSGANKIDEWCIKNDVHGYAISFGSHTPAIDDRVYLDDEEVQGRYQIYGRRFLFNDEGALFGIELLVNNDYSRK